VVAPSDNSIETPSRNLSLLTGEGIVIDIGTGDGHFVYQCARQNPRKFYIGIDANSRPLKKVSEKIHRKPSKGGLPNVLFLHSSIEDLPSELDGIADEIHIHFPWGSLLRAVATGDIEILRNLRRICSPDALLEVVIGLDPERDRSEMVRLGLPTITIAYIDSILAHPYRSAGFEITERVEIPASDWPTLQTSWAKRLKGSVSRSLVCIIARAAEP
jgi:16S rRNA (adenine(1408)-N(1))-methyltransferase